MLSRLTIKSISNSVVSIDELLSWDESLSLKKKSNIEFKKIAPAHVIEPGVLCFLGSAKFLHRFQESKVDFSQVGVVLKEAHTFSEKDLEGVGVVFESNSFDYSMAKASELFYRRLIPELNHLIDGRQLGTASIDPSAEIAQGVFIGDNVEIGAGVKIHAGSTLMAYSQVGEGSEIFPNVVLYPKVKIGKYCRLHAGAIIGADGFGYKFHQGIHHKIWHMGGVEIGNQVEIGANSCIDGGAFVPTRVGEGSKIDNQVQVGHNCQLGRGVILCGQVALGGSAILEDYCMLGGAVGIGPDVKLGMGSQVAASAKVNRDWPAGSKLGGIPAVEMKEWLRGLSFLKRNSREKK